MNKQIKIEVLPSKSGNSYVRKDTIIGANEYFKKRFKKIKEFMLL